MLGCRSRCSPTPQELGLTNEWVSETIFTTLFVSFMLWTFSPFVFVRKRFYTAVIWSRLLMVLVGEHLLACSCPTDLAAA
jgi:hypothetical protein